MPDDEHRPGAGDPPAADGSDKQYGELVGFAEMVAEVALSFLAERQGGTPPTLVEQIVAGAVMVIPGTAAAAVETLDADGRLQAPIAEGDDVARSVMDAQNNSGQGPCLDALRDNKQVVVDDLSTDPRWPSFADRAAALGVRSMICTPMEAAERKLGVLGLVSRIARFAQNNETPVMASVFAAHAAVALTGNARLEMVNAALTSRDLIGQAKGVLMERFKVTPDVAFAMLVRTSSVTNLRLRVVCEQLCATGVLLPDPPRVRRRRSGP